MARATRSAAASGGTTSLAPAPNASIGSASASPTTMTGTSGARSRRETITSVPVASGRSSEVTTTSMPPSARLASAPRRSSARSSVHPSSAPGSTPTARTDSFRSRAALIRTSLSRPRRRSPLLPHVGSAEGGADRRQRRWILQARHVARIVAHDRRADRPPEDLRRARPRELGDHEHARRAERLAQMPGHERRELFREAVRDLTLRDHEAPDRLALDLVRDADHGGFGHRGVQRQDALDLGRAQALARDVHRVVAPSVEEPLAVLVDARPVAVAPDTVEPAPVRVQVAFGVAAEAPGHARPRLAAHELTDLARVGHRPIRSEHRDVHPEGRAASRVRAG